MNVVSALLATVRAIFLIVFRLDAETLIVTTVEVFCSTLPRNRAINAEPSEILREFIFNVLTSTVSSNVKMICIGSSISLSSKPTSSGGDVSGV